MRTYVHHGNRIVGIVARTADAVSIEADAQNRFAALEQESEHAEADLRRRQDLLTELDDVRREMYAVRMRFEQLKARLHHEGTQLTKTKENENE